MDLFYSVFISCILFGNINLSWTLPSSAVAEGEERKPLEQRKGGRIISPGICCRQNLVDKSADCTSCNLHEVPQYLFPDIEALILTDNKLISLLQESFERYLQLKVLYLDYNFIAEIKNNTFYRLQRLEKIVSTDNNYGMNFNPIIFKHSYNLRYVDLSSVYFFQNFDYSVINFLLKLETLNMMGNWLRCINISSCHGKREQLLIDLSGNFIPELSPKTVHFSCQVDALVLDGNPLQSIDPITIATLPLRSLSLGDYRRPPEVLQSLFLGVSMSKIEEISIRNAGINELPSGLFDHLQNKTLSLLDLSGNNLILYPLVFSNLSLVSALYLMNIALTKLLPEYFYGMNRLRNLTVGSSTATTELNPNYSVWKTNLTSLSIQIKWRKDSQHCRLSDDFLNGLRHLKYLNFIDLDSSWPICEANVIFIYSDSVEQIDIGISRGKYFLVFDTPNVHNLTCFGITSSHAFSFRFFPGRLFLISPEDIQITHARLGETTNLFYQFYQGHTVHVNLSYNNIREIPSGDFANYTSLETLDLNANIIASIASDAFARLVSLRRLYLEHNELIHLSHDTFQAMTCLQYLHLDNNKLYYLDKDLFSNNLMLKKLTLSSNQFTDFNRSTFVVIRSSLEIIDISFNVIICNCDNLWFVKEFEERLNNADNTFCSNQVQTLHQLRGKPLSMFITDNYCSYPYTLPVYICIFHNCNIYLGSCNCLQKLT